MVISRSIVSVVSLFYLFMSGCLRDAPVEVNRDLVPARLEKLSAPPRPTKDEIAKKVEGALRDAKYLEVVCAVNQHRVSDEKLVSTPIVVRSWMAKDTLKTELCDNSGILIRGFSLVDGVVQEYSKERGVVDEYPARFINGIDGAEHALQSDCLIGSHHFSWVGVPEKNTLAQSMDIARSFRNKIDKGVQEKDRSEQGIDCYVFTQTINFTDDKIVHTIYVDKKRFLVVRWDMNSGNLITTKEFVVNTRDSVPANMDWKIHKPGITTAVATEPSR